MTDRMLWISPLSKLSTDMPNHLVALLVSAESAQPITSGACQGIPVPVNFLQSWQKLTYG